MKKLGLMCLTLLIALGLVGPGYAWWSDTVEVKKRLESGSLELGVRVADDDEAEPARNRKGKGEGKDEKPEKDETDGYIQFEDGIYIFKLDGKKYAESVNVNVYGSPSFSPEYTIEIANGGSIPAQLDDFFVTWEGEISEDLVEIRKWSVTSPDGIKEKGEGFEDLSDFTRGMIIDPEGLISIEMLLSLKQTGSTEGEIFAYASQWNGVVWNPKNERKRATK
ncbi:MAG: hypothetical protein PHT62_05945 [Desulfotomaculaceae bacterium]|nr:hypothetical protein [Desulfotomaculaceae bacterium]